MKTLILAIFLVLISFNISNSHEEESYYCHRILVRDAPQHKYEHHTHFLKHKINNMKELEGFYRLVIFDSLTDISTNEINFLLSANFGSISLREINKINNKELKLLMNLSRNNEVAIEVDDYNSFQNDSLWLDSMVVRVEPRVAKQAFASVSTLMLDGLDVLTDDQCSILTSYRGVYLQLAGITDLSDKQIKILSKCKSMIQCLPNLNVDDKVLFEKYRKEYIKYPSK